ncbi:unnamed protein product [Mycena citricolor]|uniref:Mixed lineage kinase domain-containing protein n=1 Tax=Mycena citricolor TaxID=2018698 RepID=A0AAD2Q4V5_9AGAR|nr:unnamed protein product [Mycena citricolor]CAK5276630.1 unnamed protein product [Mycena citricolor]
MSQPKSMSIPIPIPAPTRASDGGENPMYLSTSEPSSFKSQMSSLSIASSEASSQGRIASTPVTSWLEKVHNALHKHTVPEVDPDLERTRVRVIQALASIGTIAVPLAIEAVSLAPVPGMSVVGKVLQSIWDSCQLIQTNRCRCLRITERCATVLMAINKIVSRSSSITQKELDEPLRELQERFQRFERFVKQQTELSFLTKILNKDDVKDQLDRHDQDIRDCVNLFQTDIDIRILDAVLRITDGGRPAPVVMPSSHSAPHFPTVPDHDLGDLDSLHSFPGFPSGPAQPMLLGGGDAASDLSQRLQAIHNGQNRLDIARDNEELAEEMQSALQASNLPVTMLLQIAVDEIPTAITLLLNQLERLKQQEDQAVQLFQSHVGHPRIVASEVSPSPRIRALSWPLDGVPARRLLHRHFMEATLDALKQELLGRSVLSRAHPLLRSPTVQGATWRVVSPSSSSSLSDYSSAVSTTTMASCSNYDREDLGTFTHSADLPVTDSAIDLSTSSGKSPAETEICYRISLSHAFHHLSPSLPLWSPSLVEMGAVGYLSRPTGEFRTLFNSRFPDTTSAGSKLRGLAIPALSSVRIIAEEQSEESATIKAKGKRFLTKLTSNSADKYKHTHHISSYGETAHLIAEKAVYHYFDSLESPKRWFRAHANTILAAFKDEVLGKDELIMVTGTVNVRDYALLVDHGNEKELRRHRFHVYSHRQMGKPWGTFDHKPETGSLDLSRPQERPTSSQTMFKVSDVGPELATVLLSRLRFSPNQLEPTSQ